MPCKPEFDPMFLLAFVAVAGVDVDECVYHPVQQRMHELPRIMIFVDLSHEVKEVRNIDLGLR